LHFTIFTLHDFSCSLFIQVISTDFILANFTITDVIEDPDTFHIHLEEINNLQSELESIKVHSKGFFPEITVQNFPHPNFLLPKELTRFNSDWCMVGCMIVAIDMYLLSILQCRSGLTL
jgi:hypothetical protein